MDNKATLLRGIIPNLEKGKNFEYYMEFATDYYTCPFVQGLGDGADRFKSMCMDAEAFAKQFYEAFTSGEWNMYNLTSHLEMHINKINELNKFYKTVGGFNEIDKGVHEKMRKYTRMIVAYSKLIEQLTK